MKRSRILMIAVAAALSAALVWWLSVASKPLMPKMLAQSLPDQCRQVLLVLAPDERSVTARIWLLENNEGEWESVREPIDCTLGHQGLAWGTGEHTAVPPPGFRIKREGDKCSPAGGKAVCSPVPQASP